MPPIVISEEVPFDSAEHHCDSLDPWKPLGGHLWWNSLYWTNFPPLAMLSQANWEENPDAELSACLRLVNSDQRLSEQYVTFGSAREDLCNSRAVPKSSVRLSVECMQYEGAKDLDWQFPLTSYAPRRDNHQPNDLQSRRFWDNGVLHLGLNAEEFSERVKPVSELDACIHIADKAAADNPTWGYHSAVLRIGGWPFRIKRLGTFEGCGDGGRRELSLGICHWDDELLWDLLEGPGAAGTNQRAGYKFWASLVDLDWLGRKVDEGKRDDPAVPPEKGFVWFTVEETIVVPSTGRKGIRVRLLEEGIVPAWMDLNFMQVFAGGEPLGGLDELTSEGPSEGTVRVLRIPTGAAEDETERKLVVSNEHCRIVFDEPMTLPVNDFVDMGWAIHDCCYRGGTIRLSPKPGRLAAEAGADQGPVAFKASGPPPLCHGDGEAKVWANSSKSDFAYERRLVM